MSNINPDGLPFKLHPSETLHFTGLIPALYDPELDSDSFRIHCMIYGMMNTGGFCSPSNEWIAERLGKSERVVTRCIQKLRKAGYIQTRIEPTANGSVRRIYRGPAALAGHKSAKLNAKPKPSDSFEEGLFSQDEKRRKESAAEKIARAKEKAEAEKAAAELAAQKVTPPPVLPAPAEAPGEEDVYLTAARIVYRKAYPTRAEWEQFMMNSAANLKRSREQLEDELQRFAQRYTEEMIEKHGEDESVALSVIKKMSHSRLWSNFRRRWLMRPYKKETMKAAVPNSRAYQPFQQ